MSEHNGSGSDEDQILLQQLLQEVIYVKADVNAIRQRQDEDKQEYRQLILELRTDLTKVFSQLSTNLSKQSSQLADTKKKQTVRQRAIRRLSPMLRRFGENWTS